jgi:uncharacterized LabA/DUF88 family protein
MNCAVFMDYDNIWISCYEHYTDTLYGLEFTEKIKKHLNDNGYNIIKFAAYANFDNGKMMTDKHQTQLQKLGLETYHCMNGKDSADINIASDALELLYVNHNIDTFVFISCDRDITPVLRKINLQCKETIIISLSINVDVETIKQYCNKHFWFEEIVGLEFKEPEKKVLDKDVFIQRLKDSLLKYPNVNYSLFSSNLEKEFNVSKGIIDYYKEELIKENIIEKHEYEFMDKMYYDGIRF